MASNFVDDIEDDSEDEFWIAASYDSVFKPKRPRLFRDRTNSLTELGDIDFHSTFRMNKRCFCNLLQTTGSNWSCVTQQNRMVEFCQFNSWSWRCDFMHQHRFFVSGGTHLCVFTAININDSFLIMRLSLI